MKSALLFRENTPPIVVKAEEIKNGIYDRNEEFVDEKYEFKVQYVKGAKGNGGPYFRLYYSYEDFKRLYPDRADRYAIVANMRRYEESKWHEYWKERFSNFCENEKYIKNEKTNRWKFADAYYEKTNTCIEFQHSYISFYFEERNAFYSELSINTIWLYDLTDANVKKDENGCLEILENNAKGFFRISEKSENLFNQQVYIQVKSGKIYRIKELFRRETSKKEKSTIRYFVPEEEYTEDEFIQAVRFNKITSVSNKETSSKPLSELWDSDYAWMIVKSIDMEKMVYINRDKNDRMVRDLKTDCIMFKYIDDIPIERKRYYFISHERERQPIWKLVKYKNKQRKN